MHFIDWIKQPWPWYISGPLIGLMVPFLLLLGNKTFGVSSSLRHICAACFPSARPFFKYDWKKEAWNLVFVTGILAGAFLAMMFLSNQQAIIINPNLAKDLSQYGIIHQDHLEPTEIFSWHSLGTARGMILMVAGGFLVGFGTRYAGGCTSGHSIMGISNLQWPSLVATICFMAGGFFMANLVLPLILKL
jgi:uncharacterized membrane protein YedE/YeeE